MRRHQPRISILLGLNEVRLKCQEVIKGIIQQLMKFSLVFREGMTEYSTRVE